MVSRSGETSVGTVEVELAEDGTASAYRTVHSRPSSGRPWRRTLLAVRRPGCAWAITPEFGAELESLRLLLRDGDGEGPHGGLYLPEDL